MRKDRKAIRHLLMQQTRRLPNREKCKILTEEHLQLIRIFKLNFTEIENFLATDSLNLKKFDIKRAAWFKVILFFILQTEWGEDDVPIYFPDDKIWDMTDPKTIEMIDEIKQKLGHSGDLATIKLQDFLAYAESDKPEL